LGVSVGVSVSVSVSAGAGVGVGVGVGLGLGLGLGHAILTWKMARMASKNESKFTRGGLSSSKSHMHAGELSAVACSASGWG